jgi:leucyl-tRNA synthetase
LRRTIHLNLQQADYDYHRLQYNTVVSATMKMLNALEDAQLPDSSEARGVKGEALGILLRVLYPVTPHITHALWTELGYTGAVADLIDAPWPQVDTAALVQDEVTLVVQVNGKLRGEVQVPAKADKAAIEAAALADANVQRFVGGQAIKKVIVVPGKLINIVV